jgi:molybdate transport system substrate-binding protein
MNPFSVLAVARVGILLLVAQAAAVSAAEITVLSTPTLKATLEKLRPEFERASGHKLVLKFDGVAPLKRQIEAGDSFDVTILLPPMIDDLTKQGKLDGSTRTDISRAAVGVAIRAGASKPDVSSIEALKQTLLKAKSMSYSPDSASGKYFAALFDRLALGAEAKSRLIPTAGAGVVDAVAKGEAELTVITVPNIVGTPGVELAGLLPEGLQNYTVFTAGVSTKAQDAEAAKTLIKFLMGPNATAVLKSKGMERVSP